MQKTTSHANGIQIDTLDYKEVKSRDAEGCYIAYLKIQQSDRHVVSERNASKAHAVSGNLLKLKEHLARYMSLNGACEMPQAVY